MGRSKWIICLCFLLGLWGCSDLKDGGVVGPPSQGTSLSFAGDIRPILQQNCASCHSGNEAPGGYDLTSFSGLLGPGSDGVSNAIPGNAQSLLVAITQSGDHAGFAGNQAGVLRKWVVEDSLGLRQPHVHPIGFMDPGSASFHGSEIASSSWDMSACRSCHGQDYEGGVALKTCVSCHINTPEDCSTCHGTGVSPAPPRDLSGSFSTQSGGVGAHQTHLLDGDLTEAIACEVCHQVPAALSDAGHVDSDRPAEVVFRDLARQGTEPAWNGTTCSNTYCHGEASPRWTSVGVGEADCGTCHGTPPDAPHPQVENCEICHGEVVDATGQIADLALHVNGKVEVNFGHPDGFVSPASENFHGLAIRAAKWELDECQACHGQDYRGSAVSSVSCLTCHPSGPDDCSVCHGSSATPAPPRDIDDHTSTDFRGVGAHRTHLNGGTVSTAIECSECHLVPAVLSDAGHVDSDLPAEITFGALAKTGERTPVWNGEGCANTYCHRSAEPRWTSVGVGEAACGTCHGTPPPAETGHPPVAQCSLCHPRVADDNLNIVNKALHINGQIEIGQ